MSIIALFHDRNSSRGRSVMKALSGGIAQSGEGHKVHEYTESEYRGHISEDIVCWYGLSGNLMQLGRDVWGSTKPNVFFDLPYWGRKREPYPQHHRFSVNGHQPTRYFQHGREGDRLSQFERVFKPWRTGKHKEILVAGMSEKQCQAWGLGSSLKFHTAMIAGIQEARNVDVAWRPKPACLVSSQPIPGTRYANGPLEAELIRSGCVWTYRSNTAIDGLIAGIPCVVQGDHPTRVLSEREVSLVAREQFCADLAYCQVSMQELRNGWAWKHIQREIQRVM